MFEHARDHAAAEEVEERPVAVRAQNNIVGPLKFGLVDNFIHRRAQDGLAANFEPGGTQRPGQLFEPRLGQGRLFLQINRRRRSRDRIHGGTNRHILRNRLNNMKKNHLAAELVPKLFRMGKNFSGDITGINGDEEGVHPDILSHLSLACEKNRKNGESRRPPSARRSPATPERVGILWLDLVGSGGDRSAMRRVLLIDISNTFTKIAIARGGRIGKIHRLATPALRAQQIRGIIRDTPLDGTVAASVVPRKNREVNAACANRVCWIGPELNLGVGIDYPTPRAIGPDRLANAAGCAAHYGVPAIVVDFGTAVTFDVISPGRDYIGGVIAPGLNAMTEYLHDRTALLPFIHLREPVAAVGRSTRDAMLSGAIHGYRGLVAEIVRQIRREAFPRRRPKIVATGGDAGLIAAGLSLFDAVDPLLTLRGLLVAADLNLD